MTAQQKQDESVVEYMSCVQVNVPKALPKLADGNRQNQAVSIFYEALGAHDVERMTVVCKDRASASTRASHQGQSRGSHVT